ncbi:hypothetical protein IPM09_03110 [Candidatus Saccharibacteria bacterium]|nr:MAG: hypothetical protein IPM09_03110 [Candidatus Saccharibacteria bacterium]
MTGLTLYAQWMMALAVSAKILYVLPPLGTLLDVGIVAWLGSWRPRGLSLVWIVRIPYRENGKKKFWQVPLLTPALLVWAMFIGSLVLLAVVLVTAAIGTARWISEYAESIVTVAVGAAILLAAYLWLRRDARRTASQPGTLNQQLHAAHGLVAATAHTAVADEPQETPVSQRWRGIVQWR